MDAASQGEDQAGEITNGQLLVSVSVLLFVVVMIVVLFELNTIQRKLASSVVVALPDRDPASRR